MNKVVRLTPQLAVTGALTREEVAEAARMGFKSILSNLPDGESSAHIPSNEEAALAAAAGLGFRHVPVKKADVFSDRVVDGMGDALAELPGPVLAHCASGLRSALAWGAAAARYQSPDAVLAVLRAAGFDFSAVRDELDELRKTRPLPEPIPPALDAGRD